MLSNFGCFDAAPLRRGAPLLLTPLSHSRFHSARPLEVKSAASRAGQTPAVISNNTKEREGSKLVLGGEQRINQCSNCIYYLLIYWIYGGRHTAKSSFMEI